MFDTRVQAFGILANNDQVDVRVAGGYVRKISDRTEICVQLEAFSQFDIDARKPAADGSCDRPL